MPLIIQGSIYMKLEVEIIGSIVSPVKEPVDENWGAIVSEIVLNEEYADGLVGLEDFSHAIIIYFMHLATDKERIKIRNNLKLILLISPRL